MDAATVIAGILGPIYIAVGIGIILDTAQYRRTAEEFLRQPALIYLGGAMALAAGAAILMFHREWSADWRVAVTVIGWLACAKGAMLLIAPKAALGLWTPVLSRPAYLRAGGLVALALGLFFSAAAYAGF